MTDLAKLQTGIVGFDDIAMGGLPGGRTTLLTGGPGSGKTVFALQTMAYQARVHGVPGIFVAFEQDPATLRTDASTFGWGLDALSENTLSFIDARPNLDLMRVGAFDVGGMLALLESRVAATGAKLVVFDGIDILMAQMGASDLIRRELTRLQNWLAKAGLTALITSKDTISDPRFVGLPSLEFLQYMVACSVMLNHDVVDDVSQRTVRIAKYRGSAFHGNAVPFLIGNEGIEVTIAGSERAPLPDFGTERMSVGVPEIDGMLQGGYFRGACVLLTGGPGTGKTAFGSAFLAAACARGERALFVSFLSRQAEIVRYQKSLSSDLEPFIKSGHLKFLTTRASLGSGESHLRSIRVTAQQHGASCIVVDPLTALTNFVSQRTAPGLTERLIDWAKGEGRTLLCTSLLDDPKELDETPMLQIVTLADTWLHLTSQLHCRGRHRALSILKSRGTGHSMQLRNFVMSDSGIALVPRSTDEGTPSQYLSGEHEDEA